MKTMVRGTIGALALVSVLTACGAMPATAEAPSLDGTAWVLTQLPGHELLSGTTATLQFAGGRVAGSDGCNRYSGSYAMQGSALKVASDLVSTQMACTPDVSEQAQAFVAALTGAASYRITGDRLELLSADGTTRVTLAAQSRALAGTAWRATGINNGKQAVSSLVRDSSVTMAFGADGVASGSAGCNRYSAAYKSDGRSLAFGQAAVTRMMCAEPEGVMEQEQQFLRALATVASVRVEGNRLELRTADGALAMTLTRLE